MKKRRPAHPCRLTRLPRGPRGCALSGHPESLPSVRPLQRQRRRLAIVSEHWFGDKRRIRNLSDRQRRWSGRRSIAARLAADQSRGAGPQTLCRSSNSEGPNRFTIRTAPGSDSRRTGPAKAMRCNARVALVGLVAGFSRRRVIIPSSMEPLPAEGIHSAATESCESGTDATEATRRNARVALAVSGAGSRRRIFKQMREPATRSRASRRRLGRL